MNILTICASNSEHSINRQLLSWVEQQIEGAELQRIDMLDLRLPIFSADWEQSSGAPAVVKHWHSEINKADGLIIACPEHNGLLPAVFKNFIDWLSRSEGNNTSIFGGDKPVMLISTSPGRRGGATNLDTLESLLKRWGGVLSGRYSLGSFHQNFSDGVLERVAAEQLKIELEAFLSSTSESSSLSA
jgi:chromate reductase